MRNPNELPFIMSEYEARLRKIREGMLARNLDALMLSTPENIYYLTGFHTRGYYTYHTLVLPVDGQAFMVIRLFEKPNVKRLSWVEQGYSYQDYEDPLQVTSTALVEAGLDKKRIGIEKDSSWLSVGTVEKLQALLPDVTFDVGSGIVERSRAVKSEAEIGYIRQAAKVVSTAFQAAFEAAEVGKTENDVAAELYREAIRSGSEYMAGQAFVASGYRSALPHASWQGRRLEGGDVIYLESSACVRRYGAALIRTIVLGEPWEEVKRMAQASIDGLESAISAIRPGVTSEEVDRACRDEIARAGFSESFVHRTGYSIGIGIAPVWGEGHVMDLKPKDRRVLEPGMVFHIVPVLFKFGEFGLGFSETVLVTESGSEVLTGFPRRLLVKK